MAAATVTRIQYFNVPTTKGSGTTALKRYVKIFVEATATAASDTLNLATYVPNLSGIISVLEAQGGVTISTAASATTWSGTTLTYAGYGETAGGVFTQEVTGYYT